MKIKNLFFILSFLMSYYSFCQKTKQSSTDRFLNELKLQKIDTICVFEKYATGFNQFDDEEYINCQYDFENVPTYLFWIQNGKTFFTKKDTCYEYSTIQIDAENVWQTYFENKKIIISEKVKEFQYEEIEKNKKVIILTTVTASDYLCQNFKLIVNNEKIEKKFTDLTLKKNYEELQNINYQYNNSLKSKVLLDLFNALISKNKSMLTKINN